MPIALDNHASLGTTVTTPLTGAYTCSGGNRLIVVGVFQGSGTTVTGVTYNGVSMTLVISFPGLLVYGLLAPATGSNTVSVAFTGVGTVWANVNSYTGVKQSGLPDAQSTLSQSLGPSTISQSVTVSALSCWVYTLCESTSGVAPTAGANVTLRDGNAVISTGDSNGAVPTGSYSQTWGITSTNSSAMVQMSFAPAPLFGQMFEVF